MADSTYRFLLFTSLMVGQPPNRKGAIESLKGDESFRICNPSNWLSWHLLLTNRDAMHSLLIPPFSIIFTPSQPHGVSSCCIVTSVFRIMCCLRSFIWGSGCSMTRNMKGICSWLTINWFRPSLLSRKYHFVLYYHFRFPRHHVWWSFISGAKCMHDKEHENMISNVSATHVYIYKDLKV